MAGGEVVTLLTEMWDWIDYWQGVFQLQASTLGVEEEMIFYGDQDRIPGYPTICLEPDVTNFSEPSSTYLGRKTTVELNFFIFVYHGEVRDPIANRRDADVLATSCKNVVHSHMTGEGRVIYCWVDSITSGYSTKAGTLVRASRLTVKATTQEQLPMVP